MADSAGTVQDQQIDKELKEIEDAPKIPVSALMPHTVGQSGRCHWCGQFVNDLVYVETFHGQERYKGVTCCGASYV